MINIRIFSQQGIDCFQEYINNLKSESSISRPDLNNEPYSKESKPMINIDETKTFQTRMEMGKYLTELFKQADVDRSAVIGNRKMWTWITYIWFDQICPVENGNRKLREMARYICSSDYTDYFRHYVANAFDIYSLYREPLCYLFLKTPVDQISDSVDAFALRQDIISNRNLVEVIHRLYWDSSLDRPKRGTANRDRPGHTRRLKKIIDQLELTYDLYSMSPDDIISLLPNEFDSWKK